MYAGKINGLAGAGQKELWIFPAWTSRGWREEYRGLTLPTLDWATEILTYAGSWMRAGRFWLSSGVLVTNFLLAGAWKVKRKLNMESCLRKIQNTLPVVGKGKYLLSPESYDNGLEDSRTPIQFVIALKQRG